MLLNFFGDKSPTVFSSVYSYVATACCVVHKPSFVDVTLKTSSSSLLYLHLGPSSFNQVFAAKMEFFWLRGIVTICLAPQTNHFRPADFVFE